MGENGKLRLPVGVSSYRDVSSRCYYVDKTNMIKDILDEETKVLLFTRPRRFGKTLNMNMLRTFFERTGEDTSKYFIDKKIWESGKEYQEHQGKYPVIFLTFKDVKYRTWEETLRILSRLIGEEFLRHREVLDNEQIELQYKEYFDKIINLKADTIDLSIALKTLSKLLDDYYGIAPIIIIDEYDIPIQQGFMSGFYDDVVLFIRNLFSGAFKDNEHLFRGVMTGILRVAKEGIFSGLNNIRVYSIFDDEYSRYFGFTHDEVKEMAAYYDAESKYDELCSWYDGYIFGSTSIFNPWSVINYFQSRCRPQAYWLSTSSNDVIGEILEEAGDDIYKNLHALFRGEPFRIYVDTNIIYPQIKSNPSSIYNFLLMTGYLKVVDKRLQPSGVETCGVALPNKEITCVYRLEILRHLRKSVLQGTANALQEALLSERGEELQLLMNRLLLQCTSYYDTADESFYHGLVIGLCSLMDDSYFITSNRESGLGRFDIQLMPRTYVFPGILIEIKTEKDLTEDKVKKLSASALRQINEKKYDTEMKAKGVGKILKYGVAFSGKMADVVCEVEEY